MVEVLVVWSIRGDDYDPRVTTQGHSQETVLDQFRATAITEPNRPLFAFVDGQGRNRDTLAYGEALQAVSVVAAYLQEEAGIGRGDRVLMVYPPSLDFVIAFIACLATGIIPVPVVPPNPFKLGRDVATFEAIAASSGASSEV